MTDKNLITSFDKIKPTEKQKARMLNAILSSEKKERIHPMKYVGVFSACAAVFAIAVVLYLYNSAGIGTYEKTPDNTVISNRKIDSDNDINNYKNEDSTSGVYEKNINSDAYSKRRIFTEDAENENLSTEKNAKTENSLTDSSDDVFLYNDFSSFVGFNEGIQTANAAYARGYDGAEEENLTAEKNSYENKRKEFFDIVGMDFTGFIKLPEDIKEEVDENQDFSLDKNVKFVFWGDEGRSLTVTLSSDTSLYDECINDDSLNKTDLSGNKLVLFSDDGIYGGYLVKNGVLYNLVSNHITVSEFENIVTSLIK